MNSRDLILQRVRQAARAYDEIDRRYIQYGPLDVHVFEDRLHDYGVRVYRSSSAQTLEAIAEALSNAGKTELLIPSGFPREFLPDQFTFRTDRDLSYQELDRAEGVLTGCALAVAETGTIFLRHSEAEGRRALTLIPDYHLCLVRLDQIVATVPEGIRRAAAFGNAPITTISGPSATSDIEMTRVKGVHGPRTLEVILLE